MNYKHILISHWQILYSVMEQIVNKLQVLMMRFILTILNLNYYLDYD